MRSARLFVPTWSGFIEIKKDIYVDRQMSMLQRDVLLETLGLANKRVSAFWGPLQSEATLFVCSTEKCFVSSGGGKAKGKALGASKILLSPRGQTIVILAHELSHVELHKRMGVFRAWRLIPSWFDEGLAVLVSQDPRYSKTAWLEETDGGENIPALDALTWGRGSWLRNYGTAREAVGRWHMRVGSQGFFSLIQDIKAGADFDTVFNRPSMLETP